MSLLPRLRSMLRNLFRKNRVERDLDREASSYVEALTREKIAAGQSPEEARRQALVEFGGVEQVKEQVREARAGALLDQLWQDVRYGLRTLRASPGFATVAVLTLALGIGANTAIFSLLNAVTLRALPVEEPGELAEIRMVVRKPRTGQFNGRRPELTNPQWELIRQRQQGFSAVMAWHTASFNLAERGEDRIIDNSLFVSGDFFRVLGVRPWAGRLFAAADDQRGCSSPGVVLSYPFWQREFGGERSAIGKTMAINSYRFEIIGVTPPEFFGVEVGRQFNLAIPICSDALLSPENARLDRRDGWWLAAMGRLKPGWNFEQATAQLTAISPALYEETLPTTYNPDDVTNYKALRLGAEPAATGVSVLRNNYGMPLVLLLAATGLVLLIACANLANLLLAQASAREREMAVRQALGASRGRIARQLLTESLLLALGGALLGIWLAGALSRAAVTMISVEANPAFVDLQPDWRVLSFTGVLAVLACVLFGIAPALRATRAAPAAAMNAGSRGTASRERFGLRRVLVVSQVALSLVLLAGALLFARSLRNLMTVDTGFAQDGILQLHVTVRAPVERRHAIREEVLVQLRGLPGVVGAASSTHEPLGGNRWDDEVYTEGPGGQKSTNTYFNAVSTDYFRTLSIPVLAGRAFSERDTLASAKVAILNESLARALFEGADPLGRTVWSEVRPGQTRELLEVVGIVKDNKYESLRAEMYPTIFLPVAQTDRAREFNAILIRTGLPLGTLTGSVKQSLTQASPTANFHFHVYKEQILESLVQERLMAALTGFFGLLAAVMASLGLYGVMSYAVARRNNEIGIRMALGAQRSDILGMILREAGMLLGVGLLLGTGLSLLATRATRALLFGLEPHDPLTLALAAVLLAAVAVAASYLPARRAARLDPMAALRLE